MRAVAALEYFAKRLAAYFAKYFLNPEWRLAASHWKPTPRRQSSRGPISEAMIRLTQFLRRNSVLLPCLLGSLVIILNCSAATDQIVPSDEVVPALAPFEAIRNEIRMRVAKGEFTAFAVGVIRGEQTVWAETFGWADREARVTATAKTPFGLASVGKSITATALMTLVEQGKIQLDEKVETIIKPERLTIYQGATDGPTLRQLLNMTAGIPHGSLTYTDAQAASRLTEEQLLRNRMLVVFPPGSVLHYSNFSIALADHVIEKVAGRSFGDSLSQAVFKPLGMKQSFVGASAIPNAKPAVRYDSDGKRIGTIYPFPRSSRDMYASLNDLIAYASFQLKRPRPGQSHILSDTAIDMMHNARSEVPGAYMALGWGSFDLPDHSRWIISNGRDMGVQAELTILPSADVAVVCLTNVTGDQAGEISLHLADALIPGFAADARAIMEAVEGANVPFRPSDDWIGEWRGTIKTSEGDLPIVMNFERTGDIKISIKDQYPTLLDEPRLGYGLLSGAFLGKFSLEESPTHYHRVELGLHRDGDRLYGFAFANFTNDKGHFELPTYISLTRAAAR
jgi:CubicO group peptidase (beta-lactamase class C family)